MIFPVYLKSKNGFFKKASNPEPKEIKMAGWFFLSPKWKWLYCDDSTVYLIILDWDWDRGERGQLSDVSHT